MKIKKVAITNFRTIKCAEFYFFQYMVFVGKNNSGKSNIMKALDVFFGRKPVEDDFRLEGKKRENEISITLTFIDLLEGEEKLYQGNILFEGTKKAQVEIKLTILHQEKIKLSLLESYGVKTIPIKVLDNDYETAHSKILRRLQR